MRAIHTSLILLTIMIGLAGCQKEQPTASSAFAVEKSWTKGPLQVNAKIDKAELSLSETVGITIETVCPGEYEVSFPDIEKFSDSNDFRLLDIKNLPDRLDKQNKIVKAVSFRLEPLITGEFDIPALLFEFKKRLTDPNSTAVEKSTIETEPIKITVISMLVGMDPNDIKMADIEGVVEMPRQIGLWWIGLAVFVLVLLLMAIYFMNRKKKTNATPIAVKLPYEIAIERLDALMAEGLIEKSLLKEFYERLCNILRYYIEDRFDLRAPERTTEEFLVEIADDNTLLPDDKHQLGQFLQQSDLVKFAKYQPATEDVDSSVEMAKAFIDKTKQVLVEQEGI